MTSITIINYIIDGVIGSVLYILVSKLGYNNRWDITRRLLLGLVAGYIAYLIKIPELATIGLGYAGIDAIEAVLIKQNLIQSYKKELLNTNKIVNNK